MNVPPRSLASRFPRSGWWWLLAVAALALGGCMVKTPVLEMVDPFEATVGTSIPVLITGSNFDDGVDIGDSTSTLRFRRISGDPAQVGASSFTFVSSARLDATVVVNAGEPADCIEVYVVNEPYDSGNSNTFSNPHDFYVDNPTGPKVARLFTINQIPRRETPTDYFREETSPITLEGDHFETGVQVLVSGTGVTVSNLVVANPTLITADVTVAADAPTGNREVRVAGTVGQSGRRRINIVARASPTPTLKMLAPNYLKQDADTGIRLFGTGFDGGLLAETPPELTPGSLPVVSSEREATYRPIGHTIGSFPLAVRSLRGVSNTVAVKVVAPGTALPKLSEARFSRDPQSLLLPGTNACVLVKGDNFGAAGLNTIRTESGFTPQIRFLPSNPGSLQKQGVIRISTGANLTPGKYHLAVETVDGLVSNALPLEVGPKPGAPRLVAVTPLNYQRGFTVPFTLTVENMSPGVPVTLHETGISGSSRVVNVSLNAAGTAITGEYKVAPNAAVTGDVATNFVVEQSGHVSNVIAIQIF